MLHPFADDPFELENLQAEQKARDEARAKRAGEASPFQDLDFSHDISYRDVHDHRVFKKPIEGVLRPHWSTVQIIRDKFLSVGLPSDVQSAIEAHGEKLDAALSAIQKSFRVYVETSSDDSLEKEASRLERRYFESTQNRRQIQFLKFKRLYEKIRTFNESAKNNWREVQKILDTLSVLKVTRTLALQIEKEYLKSLTLLIRQTDSFLDELRLYMNVRKENVDQITGSHKIDVNYDEDIRYTVYGLLDEPEPGEMPTQVDDQEKEAEEQDKEEAVGPDLGGSIAYNIVLETREHKLNRASIISVPLLGSRDWNRSPHYNLEVPIKFFEECVTLLKEAYHVNVDENDILHVPMTTAAAVVRKGQGEHAIVPYHDLITDSLAKMANGVLEEDFPGVEKPEVFLYHCGPNVFYRILLGDLRGRGLGEMFYLDHNNNTVREYPEEFLKKVLIDWWNARLKEKDVTGEDVDSYLTYSRQLEMVKREYRILYEEGVSLRKREQPGVTYLGVEKWLKENKLRVFGLRKMEIFRRFVQGTVIE